LLILPFICATTLTLRFGSVRARNDIIGLYKLCMIDDTWTLVSVDIGSAFCFGLGVTNNPLPNQTAIANMKSKAKRILVFKESPQKCSRLNHFFSNLWAMILMHSHSRYVSTRL
jgi:hypothetical protein